MARCDVPGCGWYGKKSGKAIHMARAHGVHPLHEGIASTSNPIARELHEPVAPDINTMLESESKGSELSSKPHPEHESIIGPVKSDLNTDSFTTLLRVKMDDGSPQAAELALVCPVIGCGKPVDDLLTHLMESHREWRLSSGKFVFEAV